MSTESECQQTLASLRQRQLNLKNQFEQKRRELMSAGERVPRNEGYKLVQLLSDMDTLTTKFNQDNNQMKLEIEKLERSLVELQRHNHLMR